MRPHAQKVEVFLKEFSKESDRASILVAGVMLHEALKTLLRGYLKPPIGKKDSLFGSPSDPLGDFGPTIDICYRVGLIPATLTRDLHLVQRMRNASAHGVAGLTFEAPEVADRVAALAKSTGLPERFSAMRARLPASPRGDFQVIVAFMLLALCRAATENQPTASFTQKWLYDARVDQHNPPS